MKFEISEVFDYVELYYPYPLFQACLALFFLKAGEVFAADPEAEEDLMRFCKRIGHELINVERLKDSTQRFLIRNKKE